MAMSSPSSKSQKNSPPVIVSPSGPWTYDLNPSNRIPDFAAELAKDMKNFKGLWSEDFTEYCKLYGILPYPNFQYGDIGSDQAFLRIANGQVDLSSWRAAMLTIGTVGSKISEISLHNVIISPQQLKDLSLTLAKQRYLSVLKLEYITLDSSHSTADYIEALRSLFTSEIDIDYLSFRGSKLGDVIVSAISQDLASSFTIRALNLSDNSLSDAAASAIVTSLYTNSGLEHICLSRNFIVGDFLRFLPPILLGSVSTTDQINAWKLMSKKIGERSKKVKDLNKKRRKLGLPDIEELNVPERIAKFEGQQAIANRVLSSIDISYNSLTVEKVQELAQQVSSKVFYPVVEGYGLTLIAIGSNVDGCSASANLLTIVTVDN